jgi:hypothetical protein
MAQPVDVSLNIAANFRERLGGFRVASLKTAL